MPDEQTILELADTTRSLLGVLERDLDSALRRGVGKEKDSMVREQNPSVVGEIIDLMHENNKRLADLSEQIKSEVLTKLDRLDRPAHPTS